MDNDDTESVIAAKTEMVAKLNSRKEALKAILEKKTIELKQLCIEEAELTGVLPAEIPLEPGESPPHFRRRVGTAFTYPENLINAGSKLNNKEESIIASIELELKIQSRIAEAALSLANDSTSSKAVRRKHQIMYKQSLNTLQELETKLKHRQGVSPTNKHQHKQRKKPRPPLEKEKEKSSNDVMLQAGGINLSPVSSSREAISPSAYSLPLSSCLESHSSSSHHFFYRNTTPKYIINEIGRTRSTHLQKYNSGYYFTSNSGNYINYSNSPQYLTLATCAHLEFTKLRNRDKLHQGFWKQHYNEHEENLESISCSEERKSNEISPYPYLKDEEAEELFDNNYTHSYYQMVDSERFRSLNKRKVNSHTHTGSSPCLEIWTSDELDSQTSSFLNHGYTLPHGFYNPSNHLSQPKATREDNKKIFPPQGPKEETLLPNQTYPEHSLGHDNRTLFRTKSLGSVETLNAQSNTDTLSRKQKEKEWFETSLDCSGPLGSQQSCTSYRSKTKPSMNNIETLSNMENIEKKPDLVKLSRSSSSASTDTRAVPTILTQITSHQPTLSPIIRSINDVPFESPKNHMVVEAGKWQPYREITKPFEMADFYKYSTKFRKNIAQNTPKPTSDSTLNSQFPSSNDQINKQNFHSEHSSPVGIQRSPNLSTPLPLLQISQTNVISHQNANQDINSNKSKPFHSMNYISRNSIHEFNSNSKDSIDNGIHEDLGHKGVAGSNNHSEISTYKNLYDLHSSISSHVYDVNANNNPRQQMLPQARNILSPNSTLSPHSALEASLTIKKEESLADAFSTEMLAWYQDQSIPRSATLV